MSPRQVVLVRDALGNAPRGAWRLLVTHHPVLPARLSGLVGREQLVGACAEADVVVLLSGHMHSPSADVVDLVAPGVHRQALALVNGTAISSRTRGTANAYGVIRLDGAMAVDGRITVQVRETASTGWAERRTAHFVLGPHGVAAVGEPA